MASVAQVRANRLNAQKSTGPRTPEGKAVVAQNAVKHGLLAQQVVVRGEDPGEFEVFRDRMVQDLGPAGSLESLLAERVAQLGWRLRRAERLDRAAWATLETDYAAREASRPPARRRPQGETQDDEETVLARVVVDDFGRAKLLERLLGYERRIENSLYRTVGELHKRRVLRAVESSDFHLQAGQDRAAAQDRVPVEGRTVQTRVNAELQTAPQPPEGVTTNEVETEDEARQTKPIGVSGSEERDSGEAIVEELGRERPGYEEPPEGGTPNEEASGDATTNGATVDLGHCSNVPAFRDSGLWPSCETKPIPAGSTDAPLPSGSEGLESEDGGRGRPTYEEPPEGGTPNEETPGDATTNGETKPIGDGEDPRGAGPFAQTGANRGAPSASFCSVRP
jgi:hypothetical protein